MMHFFGTGLASASPASKNQRPRTFARDDIEKLGRPPLLERGG